MYLWAALALAACTGDDDAAWPEGGVPLELYAAVEGYSSANAQTRATTENRWEGGEVVRLWIRSRSIGSPNEIHLSVDSDGKVTLCVRSPSLGEQQEGLSMDSDGKLVATKAVNWMSPDEEKTIYAHYPMSINALSFPVQDNQTDEGYQQSDYMLAPYIRITRNIPR